MTKQEKRIVKRALIKTIFFKNKWKEFSDAYKELDELESILRVLFDDNELKADMAEAKIMQKTTQRSPEFRGRANC